MASDPSPSRAAPGAAAADPAGDLALVMSGGGALAAYQVGLLCHLAEHHPRLRVPILTGVSAGAVNAAALACLEGNFAQRVQGLVDAWHELSTEKVFDVESLQLFSRVFRWGLRLVSGTRKPVERPRSLLDTAPLREFLCDLFCAPDGTLAGVASNIDAGELRALAITASSYTTENSVTWVQDRDSVPWRRAHRISRHGTMRIDHVMASAALPLLFPAVEVDGEWYGDGGLQLTAPFSPAIHLGADRILAISTRFRHAAPTGVATYPPPAQIAGALLNAMFLEHSEGDALRIERINQLIAGLPPEKRDEFRPVELLTLRPSVDLGKLANEYEPRLPRTLRFLIQGLGTRETRDNSLLAMLMFQNDYLRALIEIGRQDAAARMAEIEAFLGRGVRVGAGEKSEEA